MKALGGLLLIVRRSLRQHLLSTSVTVFSTAIAVGLVMSVFHLNAQTRQAFLLDGFGADAVLGARGSKLQLVLNSVFHLETSPGNIPWSLYEEMRLNARVEMAVPYAVGDNYRGFRIVGTTLELFERLEVARGKKLVVQPGGVVFDPNVREAVIGSVVAQNSDLRLGSLFQPRHGVVSSAGSEVIHPEEYQVVGVLEPTGTPIDRVVFIPIEGIFRMEGHELRGAGEQYKPEAGVDIPDEHKEVSAVLLKFRGGPMTGRFFDMQINMQGKEATLAFPLAQVLLEIFQKLGWMVQVLGTVAILVALVAGSSILAALYNTMNERRREFAILRALGAKRRTVSSAIVLESSAIALLGALGGLLVYGGIFGAAAYVVRKETGVVLDPLAYHPSLVLAPLGMVVLGALAGILPALKAYSTDVAANLVPTS